MRFASHEDYFLTVLPAVRPLLESIQQRVELLLPEATRCISYNMPAFRNKKRAFFYFAAFKHHIGVYPPVSGNAEFIYKLTPYMGPKGNLSFSLNVPLPIDLICQVSIALYQQYDI
ncbi:hypothetical protein FJ444_07820 [Aestuariibacter sp. GS-14]|uniref:iron chaperone n=1 Tax=Aestuariibacter sp. GS-14 TaxID=2590670 RepID=UPI00112AF299|nr:hypothetical protein [Aestuariibacter sp. GS-14]TPV60046.1 hypothetical protein FJ444_07820 [Aestuariibacter sp. GS-14]